MDLETRAVKAAPVHPRGEAPTSSVVSSDGRSHEVDNLHIADTSAFPR